MAKNQTSNRYSQLLEAFFERYYQTGVGEIVFERTAINQVAGEIGVKLPKNLGDILYSFRYRTDLPPNMVAKAPSGYAWIIRPAGRAKYKFVLVKQAIIVASDILIEIKIPDATPGVIARYSLNDEQALLAKLRYNRLIDIFTGLTCYSLQSHLRTTLRDGSQIETDEIYIGIDRRGVHFVLPVQAKDRKDKIGIVQIEQDLDMCAAKFPHLICRAIAAQVLKDDLIVLFELEATSEGVKVVAEKHYRLVTLEDLSPAELENYRIRQG